jgi:hypothetical protein
MKLLTISIVLFSTNQVLQFYGLSTEFMTSYLDDLLFFPITLSLIRIFENRNKNFEIPIYHSLIGLILISLLYEYLVPKIDQRFTADTVDILYYSIGIIIYHLTRIKIKTRANKKYSAFGRYC